MKSFAPLSISLLAVARLHAHDPSDPDHDPDHPHTHAPLFVQAKPLPTSAEHASPSAKAAPPQAAPFAIFSPAVTTRWDERFLFIESNGLAAHDMMVGITAWQQQVPLPQRYTGGNAWRIPLHPVPAKEPLRVRDRFLRGAIAIAVNGIPIFNPQNNRGEISYEIGELDQWGGHCGRADDYHYHLAPLHLQKALGKDKPLAYALDGYPIYGLTEPDGSAPEGLDALHGHHSPELGYHYHASEKYPYVIGGFYGEVTERDGQVDPQPRAQPVREALKVLPGAKITEFHTSDDGKSRRLVYEVNGRTAEVLYTEAVSGTWKFTFADSDGTRKEATYQERKGGGGGAMERRPRGEEERPPRGDDARPQLPGGSAAHAEMDALKKPLDGFVLSSPDISDPAKLPVQFTGDGDGVSPPLAWKGAPAGTQSYALIMDHLTPDETIKTCWVMWDIPAAEASLPKAARGVGHTGASSRGSVAYEPPHSKGPGPKTYTLTLYALSAAAAPQGEAMTVTRESLIQAMKGKVLGSASLAVTYSRDETNRTKPEKQTGR